MFSMTTFINDLDENIVCMVGKFVNTLFKRHLDRHTDRNGFER